MKVYPLFFVLSYIVLSAACSKNNTSDPNPDPVDTPVTLLSKTVTYYNDTSEAPYYIDYLEYNDNNQVSKINTYRQPNDTITYTFAYNNTGNITEMHITDMQIPNNNYNYYFSYNSAQKLESIKHAGAFETFYSVLKYNTNSQLSEVQTSLVSGKDTTLYYHTKYFRSTQIDSIQSDNLTSNDRMQLIFTASTIDPKPILAINKAYLLMLASRSDFRTLFKADLLDPSQFTLQFANPDELLIKNCTRSYDAIGTLHPFGSPVTNTFSMNPAGAVRLYENIYFDGLLNHYMYINFQYVTR